jgi:Ni/Co efflux regulator RcnB
MFRILLIALATCSLSASPALSQVSHEQQKQVQKRPTGEANSQAQHGGLKRDRQISREVFRNAHNRMRDGNRSYR